MSIPRSFCLASVLLAIVSPAITAEVVWSECGKGLECGKVEVSLEYGKSTANPPPPEEKASIAVIRYNSTVAADKRLGSLYVNPGGPGASGVDFVSAGAGAAISTLTGGLYDIIGWDPRGVGATTPKLHCFPDAGTEYDFANGLPSGPNLWLDSFANSSADNQVETAIADYDTAMASLADACVKQNPKALYTSSTAYVAVDMAYISDAIDGRGNAINFWGFSYGTVFLAEFAQRFPSRVGRMVADGVFDAGANAKTYVDQLPNDQVSVRDAINDLLALCETAGPDGCAFATPPAGVTANLAKRLDGIFEDLFLRPITISGLTISLDIFNVFMSSFLRVPTTHQMVMEVLSGLEVRNATALLSVLSSTAETAPIDRSAPDVGTLVTNPLQCVDNAASSSVTLDEVVALTKSISIAEDTPLLSAGLAPITFCRNFPDTRPLLPNFGMSMMKETNAELLARGAKILIASPAHDPTTPLKSANNLRAMLPDSSVLAIRGGPGHTTISYASLGMAETISTFFTTGKLPADGAYFAADQNIFPPGVAEPTLVAPAKFNGTDYTTEQIAMLEATYAIGLAFLAIA